MTFYYATLADADALYAVMTYGIQLAEDQELIPMADTPTLAARLAMVKYDLAREDTIELYVYSIDVPEGEWIQPIKNNDKNLKEYEFYGYAGSIPAEWIDREYLITTLTSEEAET